MVPGLEIYQLAFSDREVGLASALAVVLMVLVLVCILPIQWLTREEPTMIIARREVWTGRALLVVLMAVTLLPFVSLFIDRPAPVRHLPVRSRLAVEPALGQLHRRVPRRATWARSAVQRAHRARRGPGLGPDRDDGGLRHSATCACPAANSSSCSSCSA